MFSLIEVYVSGGYQINPKMYYWEGMMKELWEAFLSRANTKQVAPNLVPQDDIKIWEAVGRLISKEFSNISEINANMLSEKLDFIHREDQAQIFLNQICK
jgi:hypothetical protein